MNNNSDVQKKKFQFPHSYVIIICMLILASLLTYIIPAGKYERAKNSQGVTTVVPDSFQSIANTPVSIFHIPDKMVDSLIDKALISTSIFIIGGVFGIIISTGVFEAFTAKIARKLVGKEIFVIPAFTLIFGCMCSTMAVNQFLGFAPIGVMIALAMGFDAVVGCGMIMLGGAVGFAAGTFQLNTTAVAQQIAELPSFSGLGYRIISFIVLMIITDLYLIKYALKIKREPKKSVMYGYHSDNEMASKGFQDFRTVEKRHIPTLIVVVAGFIWLIYGCIRFSWGLDKASIVFIWMGILAGAAYGYGPSKIAGEFVKGAGKMVEPAILVGFGSAIALILSSGNVLDSVVRFLSQIMVGIPMILRGPAMYIMNTIVNFFVVGGTSQAAVVIPIFTPIADLVGMTRQSTILAYNFGDGLCNYILPHSSALMGFIGMAGIPYDRWMRFMWKLFLIWALTACVLTGIAVMIGY